jgi:hypothetical protein
MRHLINGAIMWLVPATAFAQQAVDTAQTTVTVGKGAVSGIWVLANISYAGMRAQGNPSRGWRIAAFIFGLPATIVTYVVVKERSERAYGIDIPRKP